MKGLFQRRTQLVILAVFILGVTAVAIADLNQIGAVPVGLDEHVRIAESGSSATHAVTFVNLSLERATIFDIIECGCDITPPRRISLAPLHWCRVSDTYVLPVTLGRDLKCADEFAVEQFGKIRYFKGCLTVELVSRLL
jgi:hypothetical protein